MSQLIFITLQIVFALENIGLNVKDPVSMTQKSPQIVFASYMKQISRSPPKNYCYLPEENDKKILMLLY